MPRLHCILHPTLCPPHFQKAGAGSAQKSWKAEQDWHSPRGATGYGSLREALARGPPLLQFPLRSLRHNKHREDLDKDVCTLKKQYIDRYTGILLNRACRLLKCCLTAIQYDLSKVSAGSLRANLTGAVKTALKGLMRKRNVVISEADKGDTTVVMNTKHYLDLALKHLSDKNTYQVLETDPTAGIARRFNSYLDDCLRNRVVTSRQYESLHLLTGIDTQTIYFMPKVHKDPLKLRPIVSCTNGPTHTASAYVDK